MRISPKERGEKTYLPFPGRKEDRELERKKIAESPPPNKESCGEGEGRGGREKRFLYPLSDKGKKKKKKKKKTRKKKRLQKFIGQLVSGVRDTSLKGDKRTS